MIKRFALLSAAVLLVTVAACNTAQSNKEAASPSASGPAPSASASPSAKPSAEPENPVDAKYISFHLPQGWKVQNGEESFAFGKDGQSVGSLEALGYSDSTEDLVPNGADVASQQELSGLPVKAVELVLQTRDGSEERHYFFFLEKQNVIYDLHFDAKQVSAVEALAIAKTAAVRSS